MYKFALPQKLTEWLRAILTPRSKNVHNFLMTVRPLSMRAWNWNATDSKKTIFDLIILRHIQRWQSKEMSLDFLHGQSVAETCLSHWGYVILCMYTGDTDTNLGSE